MLINVYLMDKFYLLNVETPQKKRRGGCMMTYVLPYRKYLY